MTDKTNETRAAAEEAEFDAQICGAFEEAGPSPEARARMLAAIQAHAEQTAQAVGGGVAAVGGGVAGKSAPAASTAAAPATDNVIGLPAPRKRMSRGMRIGLPIAACAVVAAICVVGITANNAFDAMTTADTVEAVAENDVVEEAEEPETATGAKMESLDVAAEEAAPMNSYMAADAADADAGAYMMPQSLGFDDFNTEEYDALEETGFVSTRVNPLSTVSADVDTASYCNLRRMINAGYDAVPTGSVRIEEMLNYFTYDYGTPAEDDGFGITTEIAPCPWNPDTQLLTLGFTTVRDTAAADKGSNLVFLIDVSGSMYGNDRLGLLQDAFAVLTDQLDENDTVSIVTYSGQEEVVLDGANGADARAIQRAIDSLEADGSTNGEAGLRMAYELAEKHFIEGGVNRIVMASDGDLNVGMTSESDLHDFVDSKRDSGIYLSVLGFGEGNYKDNKMETLADHGNGNYHYIDCIEEAEKVLGEDLMANLVPFADDVKVQVEFNPAQVKAYRLIGYENRALAAEDFLDDTVDAGEVGPNMQFTVAYEIALADSALDVQVPELKYGSEGASADDSAAAQLERYGAQGEVADELLTASLRYRAFADGAVHQGEAVVERDDITDNPSDDLAFAAAVIEFGMALRGSDYAGTSSMDTAIALLESMDLNPERADFLKLVKRAERNQVRASDTVDDWGYDWGEDIDMAE